MDEEDISDDEKMQTCEICQNESFYILKHLKESKECKEKYSPEGLKSLHEIARKRRNVRRRARYDPASESKRKKEAYDAAKMSKRNKKNYEKNKSKILQTSQHKRDKFKVSMNPEKSGTYLMKVTLMLKQFDLKEGPIYLCICCGGLKYHEGVSDARLEKEVFEKYVNFPKDQEIWICHNCFWHLKYYKTRPTIPSNLVQFAPFCLPKGRGRRRSPDYAILYSAFTLQKMPLQILKSCKDTRHAQVIDNIQFDEYQKYCYRKLDFKIKCHEFLLAFGEWTRSEERENPFHVFKYCLCYLKIQTNGEVDFVMSPTKPNHYDASIWFQDWYNYKDLVNATEIKLALKLMSCTNPEQEKQYLLKEGYDDLVFLYDWNGNKGFLL